MFRLTREVRFAINADDQPSAFFLGPPFSGPPSPAPPAVESNSREAALPAAKAFNSFAGFPSMTGLGAYVSVEVTLGGPLDPASQYLLNIRDIDSAVRRLAIPFVAAAYRNQTTGPATLAAELFERLRKGAWPNSASASTRSETDHRSEGEERSGVAGRSEAAMLSDAAASSPSQYIRAAKNLSSASSPTLESVRLNLSPFLSVSAKSTELPMVRLSQRFEFSASHRLHNPALGEAENLALFGKCNNPHGHGHNYEVQVTLIGRPDESGLLMPIPAMEKIVAETVIDRFDHKHLNVEVAEFRELIPTVENIAMVIYRLLEPRFTSPSARLAAVTVWETPKTWCEYSE